MGAFDERLRSLFSLTWSDKSSFQKKEQHKLIDCCDMDPVCDCNNFIR